MFAFANNIDTDANDESIDDQTPTPNSLKIQFMNYERVRVRATRTQKKYYKINANTTKNFLR